MGIPLSPNTDDTVSISVEAVLGGYGDMDSYGRHSPSASGMLPATQLCLCGKAYQSELLLRES